MTNKVDQNCINNLDLIELYVDNNSIINNVNFMKNLKKLNASGSLCGIDQNGINTLDLIELDFRNNSKINDVNFMKNLR